MNGIIDRHKHKERKHRHHPNREKREVRCIVLRHIYSYGPATVWRCTLAAGTNNVEDTIEYLHSRHFIRQCETTSTSSTRKLRAYAITENGIAYMNLLGEMLSLLGIDLSSRPSLASYTSV